MKISLPQTIKQLVKDTHRANQTLVLATGVFDVLHQEHRKFLLAARAVGEILIVGLESDKRVKKIKGNNRPINNEQVRLSNLSNWPMVDGVFILPVDFHLVEQREALINLIKPHLLAVSSHTDHLEEKKRIVEQFGGKMQVVYQHNPVVSSTKLLNEVIEQ